MPTSIRNNRLPRRSRKLVRSRGQAGFTIVETCIAMVIMMVAALASASLFAFSIRNNSGASDRELAMAVAQQELERLRNVAFTDTTLTATNTSGTTTTVTNANRSYTVRKIVTDSNVINGAATIKTITIQVSPAGGAVNGNLGSVSLKTQRSTLLKGPYS